MTFRHLLLLSASALLPTAQAGAAGIEPAAVSFTQQAPTQPDQTPARSALADVDAEVRAYGAWALQLDSAAAPALEAVRDLGPEFQRALAGGNLRANLPRFRNFVRSAITAIDQAEANVAALPTPRFDELDLGPTMTPAALRE
jgi:hypothetical protein